jgi:beta-glucanase (GH16 family)/Ca2+-binding RTX toxin-like protein
VPYYNSRGVLMPESAKDIRAVNGTAAKETLYAPEGPSVVVGNGGGDVIHASAGDNIFWLSRDDTVIAQAGLPGVKTIKGWDLLTLPDNVHNLTVNGAQNYAVGNSLDNLIIVDDNDAQWAYGGRGDDVLVGGFGRENFLVRVGEGSDVIYGWHGGDEVRILGGNFATFDQVRAAMRQEGADAVLQISASETLTFRNTQVGSFQADDFLLPLDRSKLGGLTFGDEFNSLQLYDFTYGTGQWRADFGGNLKDIWAYSLPSNNERQAYVTEDFQGGWNQSLGINPFNVQNGVLSITARQVTGDAWQLGTWGRDYASGMINTFGIFEQKYGYFEMRADFPEAKGAWPAFWLMPNPYVANVEADIIEGLGAVPSKAFVRARGEGELYDDIYMPSPEGFHTYGMLWTASTVTFYVDDVAVMQGPTPTNWTMPMSIIANLAVGGWGGEPNPGAFPADLKIDYIRVYGLADGSSVTRHETPEIPAATLRPVGGVTNLGGGQPQLAPPAATGQILVGQAPSGAPAGKALALWDNAGAVYFAVSTGGGYGPAQTFMAGDDSQIKGGTWLADGRVAVVWLQNDGGVTHAWSAIIDPATLKFDRQQLGVADGGLKIVPTATGFAASWHSGGAIEGRAYVALAYDEKGYYGTAIKLSGDVVGVDGAGHVVTAWKDGSGATLQQTWSVHRSAAQSGLQGNDTLTGTGGSDKLWGYEGDDSIAGGAGFDNTHGNQGADTIRGEDGDDWVVGGKDPDQLYGGPGRDLVYGNIGDDVGYGGIGDDVLLGGQDQDQMFGQDGNDTVSGDRGADTLSGGAGADQFYSFAGAGLDRVTDFNFAEGDRVRLNGVTAYQVSQSGADTVISFGAGDQMVLAGVNAAALPEGWIAVG